MSDVKELRSSARCIKKAKIFRTYRYANDTLLNRPTGEKAISKDGINVLLAYTYINMTQYH